jgi:hypothetical protein
VSGGIRWEHTTARPIRPQPYAAASLTAALTVTQGPFRDATFKNVLDQPLWFPETPTTSASLKALVKALLVKDPLQVRSRVGWVTLRALAG